jgi:hypothetical protein
MKYQVAIPSHKRVDQLQRRTLKTLDDGAVPLEKVTVFCSSSQQKRAYVDALPSAVDVVNGGMGIGTVRNFIHTYYPQGTHVFQLDDDIDGLYQRVNESTVTPLNNVHEFVKRCFQLCEAKGYHLWGVYPVKNPLFMNDRVTEDLRFICASLFGITVRDHDACHIDVDLKVDYELSIKHYVHDGGVLRFENVCYETNYYTNPGGLHDRRDVQMSVDAARTLCSKYPKFCKVNTARQNDYCEVKLAVDESRTQRQALQGLYSSTSINPQTNNG